MASSSNDPDSLVTLHFHDFRVERMRHWWTLLGEDDHADIVGFFGKFPPFMRLPARPPLSARLRSYPFRGPRSNRCLEKYLGLTTAVLRPEIARPEATWRKANISLDLLTKYFSRSAFPARLARDFIAGKKGNGRNSESMPSRSPFAGIFLFPYFCWRQGEGVPMFCTQLPSALVLQSPAALSYRLQTPYHFERHTVSQTVDIALPFTGNSRDWASYLLDLPLGEWSWKVTWGPAVVEALDSLCPLRWSASSWGVGLYRATIPALLFVSLGGVQYPPRLGDLDAEMVLIEEGSPGDSSVTFGLCRVERGVDSLFHSQAYSTARAVITTSLLGQSEREASAARVESLRSTLHHNSVAVANVRRDLVAQRGNVSTLRTMNEFIREQLEISEDAKEQLEENLAEAREQLETEQAERTRVQDELDSLRSYTQALVDPATGRPQDIVALRRALDASEEALTSARTSMGVMRVQISVLQGDNGVLQSELDLVHDALESNASWLNQEGFPVVTSLHQINPGDGFFGYQSSRRLGGA
uniref:Uncharacterized protein n=1 Tax=Fagus sylvatica TaxID=28930 RepID=A0A2N9FK44_FAGSY